MTRRHSVDRRRSSESQVVSLDEHQRALAKIEQQQLELARLNVPAETSTVKKHLRCPLCWDRYQGKAARRKWQRQVSGSLQQRCYCCDQCGTEWVVEVRSEETDGILHTTTKVAVIKHVE